MCRCVYAGVHMRKAMVIKLTVSQTFGSSPGMRAGSVFFFFIIGQELPWISLTTSVQKFNIYKNMSTKDEYKYKNTHREHKRSHTYQSICCRNWISCWLLITTENASGLPGIEVPWWASDGSMRYRMNFPTNSVVSLAVMLQGQSWKSPFCFFSYGANKRLILHFRWHLKRWTALNSTSNDATVNISQIHYFWYLMNTPRFQNFTSTISRHEHSSLIDS